MRANKTLSGLLRLLFLFQALSGYPYAPVQGQPDSSVYFKPSLSVGFQSSRGFIIPHSESIRSISYSNPWGLETNIGWHFRDAKSQSYCNCFPRVGISASYVNFDNPKILGHSFTLAPYVEPFIPVGRNFSVAIRFSAGAAYLDQVYHPVTNPDNLFYSKHFSYILSLAPSLVFRKFQNWNLRLAGNYNHISNGGNRLPNKGINFPTLSLGVDYIFSPVDFSRKTVLQNVEQIKKSRIYFILLGTAKTPSYQTSGRKFLYGINISYGYKVSRLSNLILGAEFVNDGALKSELARNYTSPPDHKRAAVLGGHELRIGRFSFSQQLAVYIYAPQKAKDPVYQRWGLDYYFNKRIFTGINLKAHRHVADFLDFRIGIQI